jgi:hypothetical protein
VVLLGTEGLVEFQVLHRELRGGHPPADRSGDPPHLEPALLGQYLLNGDQGKGKS